MDAAGRLRELQDPAGTFYGGDNLNSPPDSAFTINDLAWAHVTLSGAAEADEARPAAALLSLLDEVLKNATPALVSGGVHTPNHRWEIASALARLWQARGAAAARSRALQWLAEGVDLQADGMFSERSANYAAHVSVPSLLAIGRILEQDEVIVSADFAVRRQAELTDAEGLVETLASRRQDQFALFDGGALHPWFRAHAARTGDPITARAAQRTSRRTDADAVLTLLALAAEDPLALGPLPMPAANPALDSPEVVELKDSGLVRVDHGRSTTVLFGGTDTAEIGRVTSGTSSQPVLSRFRGSSLGVQDLRLSRDFFSVGPLRPSAPRPMQDSSLSDVPETLRYTLQEQVSAEYFHPLPPVHHSAEGRYGLEFNGRFAAAMDFSRRPTDIITLRTWMQVSISPQRLELRWEFEGPETRLCLLLALDGAEKLSGLPADAHGRRVLSPQNFGISGTAACTVTGHDERLEVSARGALGGHAFYDPGEAYSFLGASDEPDGDVLLIPASTAEPLVLRLQLSSALSS